MTETVEKNSIILRKAAEGLRVLGFTKFIRHDDKGRMCALGAIEHALGPHMSFLVADDHLAVKAFAQHVPDISKQTWSGNPLSYCIAEWNNAPERTAEEVIATFLAAAACEEHKEQETPTP